MKKWMPDQVGHDKMAVIPAQAGIHGNRRHGPPIESGVTMKKWMPDRVGHDKMAVIPAQAGIHGSRRHGPPI